MSLASRRIKQFELDPEDLEAQMAKIVGGIDEDEYTAALSVAIRSLEPDTIVQARVDSVDKHTGQVVLDIGGKAEGNIALSEFGETMPQDGEVFDVYYGGLNDDDTANLSKRRADRQKAWDCLLYTSPSPRD